MPLPPVTTNLQFWFDARDLVLSDGAGISVFHDSSANANDATITSGSAIYHTNQYNGAGAVTLSSCKAAFANVMASTDEHTAFCVFKISATSKGTVLGGLVNDFAYWISGSFQGMDSQGNVQLSNGSDSINTTAWHQAVGQHAGSTSTPGTLNKFWFDRAVDTAVGNSGANCPQPTVIGWNAQNGSEFFAGQIQIIGYWNRVLTSTEIGQIWTSSAGIQKPWIAMIT